jgi:two-component system sensor histidine kinase CpxA
MSLFLKVFLWFWLATALVIGAFILATELTRPDEEFSRGSLMDDYTSFIARTAAHTYEREGPAALAAYLERMERETRVRPRLLDAQGAELSGLGAQEGAGDLARRAAGASGRVSDRSRGKHLVAFAADVEGGRRYVFVGELSAPPRRPPFSNPESLIPRLLAVLLTAGVLCYLLARYIVSPVVKLRGVTRQVAGGDLSARVGPLLGRRGDELAAMGHDFDAMAGRVETLVSAQQRLIRDISHELRSPLARLAVALDLARKRAGAEAAGALDRIELEATRLNEMIGHLLALSRRETGMEGTRWGALDLAALVREVAADADYEARGRGRAVVVSGPEECRVTGSHAHLRSAVENVVRNAVRHAPEKTNVEITLGCAEGQAVVAVRDRGAGVPEGMLEEIFRPFYRVEEARDRETGGTGLGLAITERYVQMHGGTVRASNAQGGGLVVEMRIPLGESLRGE